MSPSSALYLSRANVEALNVSMKEVIRIMEKAFYEKAAGRTEMPPKPGIHPQKDSFIHAMPPHLPKMKAVGIKWVSGFPENPKRGLPYISALAVLNDIQPGLPVCVMDCTWIIAKRTGAATAVTAKYLAREDSKSLGILGCGEQGMSNLEALSVMCKNLEEVKAYDIVEKNLERYVNEMTRKLGFKISPVNHPMKAIEKCDIVVTPGPILKHPQPIFEKSWFKDGGLACPLDFDSCWKPGAMHFMDKFCTDDQDQLAYYKTQGYFSNIPKVYADLGEIVSGKKLGRENSKERIMSMNLGLTIEDIATASLIYEKARKTGVGTSLPL